MAKKKIAAKPGDVISVALPALNRRVDMKTNEKTVTLYANNASVEASSWDVKIRLGQIQSASAEVVGVLDVAHIYMSHEHARLFATALVNTMQQLDELKQKAAAIATQLK